MAKHFVIFSDRNEKTIEYTGNIKAPVNIISYPEKDKTHSLIQDQGYSFFATFNHPYKLNFGINAGVIPGYPLSGHLKKHHHELSEDFNTCKNVLETSPNIFRNNKKHNLS